jgi:hypothetical protein
MLILESQPSVGFIVSRTDEIVQILRWQLAARQGQANRKRVDKTIEQAIQLYMKECDEKIQAEDESYMSDVRVFDMLQEPFHQAEKDCFIISNALSAAGASLEDSRARSKMHRTYSTLQKEINQFLSQLRRILYLIGDVALEALLGRANFAKKYRERKLAFQTVGDVEDLELEMY